MVVCIQYGYAYNDSEIDYFIYFGVMKQNIFYKDGYKYVFDDNSYNYGIDYNVVFNRKYSIGLNYREGSNDMKSSCPTTTIFNVRCASAIKIDSYIINFQYLFNSGIYVGSGIGVYRYYTDIFRNGVTITGFSSDEVYSNNTKVAPSLNIGYRHTFTNKVIMNLSYEYAFLIDKTINAINTFYLSIGFQI
jgi:opacity protein-like surface antigen